jgi:predicted anti-sigma-YlaC factor YlaD
MNSQHSNTQDSCSSQKIIAYLEAELSPQDEITLEKHFASCKSCADELNDQKRMLFALDFALEEHENDLEIPEDFAKVVVTSAESNVRGLRRPQERFRALFVCAALGLLVLVGLGKETGAFVNTSESFIGQSWAIGGYALQFLHDIGVGIAVVLRCLGQRFVFNSAISLGILLVFFAVTSFVVSRLLFGQNRA